MKPERRVVFVGAYGIQNAGDDAPLLVLTEGLRRAHPEVDYRFTVLARHADPLLERLAGARVLPNLEYPSREDARGKWFRGFHPGDDRADLERIEEEIRAADLVVAGAGNALLDLSLDLFRGPIPLLATYAFLCDLHRVPLMLYGISAGPLATQRGRDLSAWIARRSRAVTCRDAASARLLSELAPETSPIVLPDPVLGLAPATDAELARLFEAEEIPLEGERARLALALRDLSFQGIDRGSIVEALRALESRYEFLFVPQCTGRDCDDREEAEAVAAELPRATCHRIRRRHAPQVLRRVYETARATLAIRLHGAAMSAMGGTPVVTLAYLPKVSAFLERVGLSEFGLDPARANGRSIAAELERAADLDRGKLALRCKNLARGVGGYVQAASELLRLPQRAAA